MSIARATTRSGPWGSRKTRKIAVLAVAALSAMLLTRGTTAQQGCELLASRPTLITSLRMFGEGGRECSGPPSPPAQIRVRLRHDRTIWFDKTLAEANGTATGNNFELGVSYACAHFERKKVYVETKNLTTGKRVESPRNTLHCVAPG